MSDQLRTLLDMGFYKENAQKALEISGGNVEQAMEWLLAHADENIPTSTTSAVPAAENTSSNNTTPSVSDVPPADAPAKSLKCDECNKLFKDQVEMQFHAAKTGHSSFSESTEEKKPLTEEEKKVQLALIEEKLKQKRAEREKQERADELEREKTRIKSGKDMSEARQRLEEMEMAKLVEQRKREKAEERIARDRVKAQIEADKMARRARQNADSNGAVSSTVTSITTQISSPPPPAASSSNSSVPKKEYSETKIQVRLQDGSVLTEKFNAKEQLSAIRTFIQVNQGAECDFDLMTSFPRKLFMEEDYEKPLDILGLVPSAVVIVTKQK